MKRCPQCEFIYEDDQSLCDMDGVLLVFDSRTLPNLHALATVSAPLPGKSSRRNRMVPAFATLILMLAVGSVYYVSNMRNTAPPNFTPASVSIEPPAAEAPVVVPEPTPEASPEASPAGRESNEVQRAPESRAAESKPKHAAAASTTTKPVATKSVSAKPEPRKDDSKVESILKKTGKILKKPFKF
jgi:hypothetical protein